MNVFTEGGCAGEVVLWMYSTKSTMDVLTEGDHEREAVLWMYLLKVAVIETQYHRYTY